MYGQFPAAKSNVRGEIIDYQNNSKKVRGGVRKAVMRRDVSMQACGPISAEEVKQCLVA